MESPQVIFFEVFDIIFIAVVNMNLRYEICLELVENGVPIYKIL